MTTVTPRPTTTANARPVTHYVRQWRQYRGLSIPALAERAVISASFISQLERGYCHYSEVSLEKIANALGTRPWQLLAGPPESGHVELYDRPTLWEKLPPERRHEADVLLAEHVEAACRMALKIWGKR